VSDRIQLVQHDRPVRVRYRGALLAETQRAVRLEEKGLPPRLYVPRSDVRMNHLQPSERRTHCPYKGDASYYSVVAGGDVADDAVWSYEDPIASVRAIKDHLCFDATRGIEIEED